MLVQIAVAVVSGFFGALLQEYVVSPIRSYKDIRRKISKDLVKYGDVISNPGSGTDVRVSEARTELRDDAAELHSVWDSMPTIVLKGVATIPSQDEMEAAEECLIRLSNIVPGIENAEINEVNMALEDQQEIRKKLGLEDPSD